MRLVGRERERAKEDLLDRLAERPHTTGELVDITTLSHYQIRTLLRETGMVAERPFGSGMRTTTLWLLAKSTE